MKVSVNVSTTTSPAVATAVAATNPTILINGTAYKVGNNCFRIFADAQNANGNAFHFADIGNGVWWSEEQNKKLVGFSITTCNQSYMIAINDKFDWDEFFSLPIKPFGTFDGTEWNGVIENSVGESCNFRCKFIYTEDESFEYMRNLYKRGEVKVIDSVETLLNGCFGRFNDFIKNEGSRAKNPFL